jgi:heme/copper-type cytochrome/quinol oxidase subunit 1
MLVEHVLTYIFTYVKKYDILKRGEAGNDGVETTSVCWILDVISGVIQFIIALLTIIHITQMGDLIHDCPLVNYYLVVDLVIMVTFLPYLYIARKFQVSQNVMRNLFTLNLVQKQKLLERRNDSSIKMVAAELD